MDHLGYRKTSLGSGSGVNVQDVTLLKIQVTYVQPPEFDSSSAKIANFVTPPQHS